jgi:cell wall-associated NlpC family hydrolase
VSGRYSLRAVCVGVLVVAATATTLPATADSPEPRHGAVDKLLGELGDTVMERFAGKEPAAGPPLPLEELTAAPDMTGVLTRLRELYRQAEEAGETYKSTDDALERQRAETARLSRALTKARKALVAGRADAGRIARVQYQGNSDLSAYLRLLLAPDPQQALDQGHLIERAASGRLAAMDRLEAGEKRARELAAASRRALEREVLLAARQKKAKDTATARLRTAEGLLASLSAEELTALAGQERRQTADAQEKLLATGALEGQRTPSTQGDRALAYAAEQIGKPYVWGAEGPQAYDCSGLTSNAWASAGRAIPRTSQEQWAELKRVPLRDLRPGDLVVYFPEATHVAMYLGDGMVIQAPRPGARVKVSPIASNPLLGAVRPDPAGPALPSYTPPELPDDATAGSDEGYDRAFG